MSGDKKTSQLQSLNDPVGSDLLYIVDNVNTTPVSKKISLDTFFGNVKSNTHIDGIFTATANAYFSGANTSFTYNVQVDGVFDTKNMVVSSNGLIIKNKLTPANSSVPAIDVGKVFYDENYLYIKVANNVIKRVSLSNF